MGQGEGRGGVRREGSVGLRRGVDVGVWCVCFLLVPVCGYVLVCLCTLVSVCVRTPEGGPARPSVVEDAIRRLGTVELTQVACTTHRHTQDKRGVIRAHPQPHAAPPIRGHASFPPCFRVSPFTAPPIYASISMYYVPLTLPAPLLEQGGVLHVVLAPLCVPLCPVLPLVGQLGLVLVHAAQQVLLVHRQPARALIDRQRH